ncbi:Thioredoxin domain-containing protein [Citrus sinensis]|uniref:Thioredoxin domain-containing protein n=1 Tax=Citrus sinensis TaxID=2711 RepID=A0ACB8KT40_CITSI|nr:Thioredoxin domain-containing protein [Citrus sinensis]
MATVATAGAHAPDVPQRAFLATRTKQLSFLSTSLKMGFNLLQLRSTAPATARKNLIIRAARIESQGVSLGFRAPHFELPEPLTGKMWKLEDFESYPALLKDIVKLSNFYMKVANPNLLKGLAVVAISSNSVATHPQDGPEFMAEEAKLFNYPFPYLYDEDGRRPFQLVYHGQFDDSRPSNNLPVTGRDIRLAIECVLSGQPVSSNQKPR